MAALVFIAAMLTPAALLTVLVSIDEHQRTTYRRDRRK